MKCIAKRGRTESTKSSSRVSATKTRAPGREVRRSLLLVWARYNTGLPKLVVSSQDGFRSEVREEASCVSVGRHPSNDYSFPEDIGLSRQHLTLERHDGGWIVQDLASKNGTYLNGARLAGPQRLRVGDRVTASGVVVVCEDSEPALRTVVFEAPSPRTVSSPQYRMSLKEALPENASDPVSALIRAGKELAIRRPLKDLFQVILKQSMDAVRADRGVLLTLENGQLVEQASRGDSFRISTLVRDRVLQHRESLLIQNVLSEETLQRRESIVFGGVQSLMAVPLQTDERVIGLLYVDSVRLLTPFTQESLSLLTVMANVVAIRLEQERLAVIAEQERFHAMELEQAAEIQRNHLPLSAPVVEGLDIAGHQSPSRTVGGDYYEFLMGARFGLVVADVAGKGLPASLMMMKMQAHVQALAELKLEPADFVGRLNRSIAATCPKNRFITFCLAELDPATRVLRYSNAGHNPPLVVHPDGSVARLTEGGPVLGLLPRIGYAAGQVQLHPGDAVVMYSDGVTEAENEAGEEFGEEQLLRVLATVRHSESVEIIREISAAVQEWTAGAPASDDRTLVVMKVLN